MASRPHRWTEFNHGVPAANGYLQRLVTAGERVGNALVYSSTYLAVIGMAEVLIVMYLLSLPMSPAPLVVGLITYAIYTNDRLVDIDSDAASNPDRTAFVVEYRVPLYVSAALAYGVAVALSAFGGPIAFGITILPAAVWVLYAIDWVPTGGFSFQRLKEILFVNSVLVAAAWAVTIVFLPVAYANTGLTPTVGIIFLYFLLATFVNTEIANVRDIASDQTAGVSTLPVVLGIERTRSVLYGITLLTAGILGLAHVVGLLSTVAVGILSVGLVGLFGVIAGVGRIENETGLSLAAECTRLPVFALLVGLLFV